MQHAHSYAARTFTSPACLSIQQRVLSTSHNMPNARAFRRQDLNDIVQKYLCEYYTFDQQSLLLHNQTKVLLHAQNNLLLRTEGYSDGDPHAKCNVVCICVGTCILIHVYVCSVCDTYTHDTGLCWRPSGRSTLCATACL
jgi:hypothetical protein